MLIYLIFGESFMVLMLISAFFYFYSFIKCRLYVSSDTYHLFFLHQADTVSLEEIKNYIKQEVLKVFEGKKIKYYTTKCKS